MRGEIGRFGREERDRIVAPIIAQPLLDEVTFVDEGMHGQQLDRGHAEIDEMFDHARTRETDERAAICRRHVGMEHRHALDVRFVEDGSHPGHVGRPIVAPRERRVDDHRFGHAAGVIAAIETQVGARRPDAIAVVRVTPAHRPGDRLRIGIEQELMMIEAMAVDRIVRPVDAISVERARSQPRHVAVPDFVGIFGQGIARDFPATAIVEHAQIDAFGVRGKQREICSRTVPRGAQGVGAPGFQSFGNRTHRAK